MVLRKWVLSALKLENYNDQANLCIQIKREQGNGKNPTTTVFLQPEGSDEVQTFFLTSPEPPTNNNTGREESPSLPAAGEANSPNSVLPDEFMAQIEACANEASMAEFPTVFYTPGVEASSSPRARAGDGTQDELPNESGNSP